MESTSHSDSNSDSFIDTGRYFADKQESTKYLNDEDLIALAVNAMGLDELAPFEPKRRIIEYMLL